MGIAGSILGAGLAAVGEGLCAVAAGLSAMIFPCMGIAVAGAAAYFGFRYLYNRFTPQQHDQSKPVEAVVLPSSQSLSALPEPQRTWRGDWHREDRPRYSWEKHRHRRARRSRHRFNNQQQKGT